MVRTVTLGFGALLIAAGLIVSGVRIRELERGELEHESQPRTLAELAKLPGATRVSARITSVELKAGEEAVFELCAGDRLEPARWRGALDLAVFALPKLELMLRVPLDDAHLAAVRRNANGACLRLGRGPIERSGRYSIDAVWPARPPPPALMQVPLQARVLALRPLTALDRAAVIAIGVGVLLLLAGGLLPRGPLAHAMVDEPDPAHSPVVLAAAPPDANADLRGTIGAALGLLALFALTRIPTAGGSATLLKGIALVALQGGGAWLLARLLYRRPALRALALARPARIARWLLGALLAGVVLSLSAKLALALVPATGEAPIQSFVSWPSGRLCFAALGIVLPLGEELFFRGYLYRVALRFGRAAAFFITVAVFVALHAEQSFGNWGGLVSIGVAGITLTLLRAWSGSVLIPALAHVLYNFTLSMASF